MHSGSLPRCVGTGVRLQGATVCTRGCPVMRREIPDNYTRSLALLFGQINSFRAPHLIFPSCPWVSKTFVTWTVRSSVSGTSRYVGKTRLRSQLLGFVTSGRARFHRTLSRIHVATCTRAPSRTRSHCATHQKPSIVVDCASVSVLTVLDVNIHMPDLHVGDTGRFDTLSTGSFCQQSLLKDTSLNTKTPQ